MSSLSIDLGLCKAWFSSIVPQNDLQKPVMHEFSELFEQTALDDGENLTNNIIIKTVHSRFTPEQLFSPLVLSNLPLSAKLRDHLIVLEFDIDPPLHPKSRNSLKIAHMLYPGEEFETHRSKITF